MISLDGSKLEGGGQLVRGAVALSALSGEAVTIASIRKNRSRPGLAAQHIAAVKAVAGLCDAECEGLAIGSRTLIFSPQQLRQQDIILDVGTAGSIPLVLQAWIPVVLQKGGSLTVSGGTEVQRSPSIDYCDQLFCDVLRSCGAAITIDIRNRGYYPEGGGEVTATVRPYFGKSISILMEPDDHRGIISCSSNLPRHVAERQAASAHGELSAIIGDLPTRIDTRSGISTGSSCTVYCGWKGGVALGRRGYPAEDVGRDAARALISEREKPGVVDIHLADQLLILLAWYGGAFTTSSLSLHAQTMHWLCTQFGYQIDLRRRGGGMVEVTA